MIITEDPIDTYCPLHMTNDGEIVTQFDRHSSETAGLVKFDFLGLRTLTIMDHAINLVRRGDPAGSLKTNFSLSRINYTDPAVFELISSGDTAGVFQIDSSGMTELCTTIQPNSLEDVIALNALYRPGPLGSGMIDDFIDCKHGRKKMEFQIDGLGQILKGTYGIIVYQEQIMQIAHEFAGYSLAEADLLRRTLGKKKSDEMAIQRERFIRGALARGLLENKAQWLFDLLAKYADYSFNKAHSVAYGILTYQTAFLKRYHRAEFMKAVAAYNKRFNEN